MIDLVGVTKLRIFLKKTKQILLFYKKKSIAYFFRF